MNLEIFVFSYNRGQYLRQCVESVKRNLGGHPLTVVDDHSQDPATRRILECLPGVVHPPAREKQHLGGLYANLQWVLEGCTADTALLLQDDVQVVRKVERRDLDAMAGFFEASPLHVVINPSFRMGRRSRQLRRFNRPWPPFEGFEFDRDGTKDQSSDTRRWYMDICVLNLRRLRESKWEFRSPESANAKQASSKFAPMLHLAVPFVCQIPEVPTSRFGKRTLADTWTHQLSGKVVNGFTDLTAAEVDRLRSLPAEQVAMAEEWLAPTNPRIRKPFVHKAVNVRWYTHALNKIEQGLGR